MQRLPLILGLTVVILLIMQPKVNPSPPDFREPIAFAVLTSGAFIAGMLARPGPALTLYATIGGALITSSLVDYVKRDHRAVPPPAAEYDLVMTVVLTMLTCVLFCQGAARVVWGSRVSAWKPEAPKGPT